jgi:hypothetical protein
MQPRILCLVHIQNVCYQRREINMKEKSGIIDISNKIVCSVVENMTTGLLLPKVCMALSLTLIFCFA